MSCLTHVSSMDLCWTPESLISWSNHENLWAGSKASPQTKQQKCNSDLVKAWYMKANAFKMHGIWPEENYTPLLLLITISLNPKPEIALITGSIHSWNLHHLNFRPLMNFDHLKFASSPRCVYSSISRVEFLIATLFLRHGRRLQVLFLSCCFSMIQKDTEKQVLHYKIRRPCQTWDRLMTGIEKMTI